MPAFEREIIVMSDWSRGYPVDSAYFDTMQPEISPFRWRPALLTARISGPSTRRFRFLELGCGSAHTLIALAACYPEAEFLGIDFMPEHVVRARALIAEIGLTNIRVEEAGFADLAAQRPEARFDYAAMHGVWSWVDAETRGDIVALLGGWLAPGALVYNGYNCAAGWAAAAPHAAKAATARRPVPLRASAHVGRTMSCAPTCCARAACVAPAFARHHRDRRAQRERRAPRTRATKALLRLRARELQRSRPYQLLISLIGDSNR